MRITPEILEEAKKLYLKGNSIREVVNIFLQEKGIKISAEVLRRGLKKLGVVRDRSSCQKVVKRRHLPVEKIIELYTKQLFSLRKLARMFKSNKRTIRKILEENGIKIRSKDESIHLANIKHPKTPFQGDECEKAYMMGLVKGDITVLPKSKYSLRLTTRTTIKPFVKLIKDTFGKYGPVYVYPVKNAGEEEIGITVEVNIKSFDFLLEVKKNHSLISKMNKKEFLSFLSGLIDADGSIILRKTGKYFQFVIRIYNEDLALLKIIEEKLDNYGFKPYIYLNFKRGTTRKYRERTIPYNNDYYTLEISNKGNCVTLLQMLDIRHPNKKRKKELILKIKKLGLVHWEDIKNFLA